MNTKRTICNIGRNSLLVIFGLLLLICPDISFAQNTLQVKTDEPFVTISAGDRMLLRYRYTNVPFKPYVQELFSPDGVNILRDAPFDHLHHHALMFAVKVDGVNFWEETPTAGKQMHQSLPNVNTDTTTDIENGIPNEMCHASFTEKVDWIKPGSKELLLKEQRTIEVRQGTDIGATLLTWQSKFKLPEGKTSATITGSHYHGLGMRFVQSMDKVGQHFNAAGKQGTVFRGDERLVRAKWCAYTATANGKPVTVAIFDDPKNLRHPATWFTMTKSFAYLSATLNYHKEPLKVIQGNLITLRYAVAVWDGKVKKEKIDKLYRQWSTQPPDAAPSCVTEAAAKQPAVTDRSPESLAMLEERIITAAEKAKRSVVRFAKPRQHPDHTPPKWSSGVIFSTDGYVATSPYNPDDLPPGEVVSIHFADGRRVPGVAVGSSRQRGFGLVKIMSDGPWSNAEIGSSTGLKLGEMCLSVAYPKANYLQERSYDREPSLRLGLLAMKAEGRWLGVSTQVGLGEDGGLFDLHGRLIGIHTKNRVLNIQPYSTIETIEQYWKELVGYTASAKHQATDQAGCVAESSSKKEPPPVPAQDDHRIAPVIAKARKVTVRYEPGGCSGVVVSPDGYVATCAHHNLNSGTDVTIYMADGRVVPGKVLGSDFLLDVCLIKIMESGPWPYAQWGTATPVKSGDLCVGIGYAQRARWDSSEERKTWKKEPQVCVGLVQDTHSAPAIIEHSMIMGPGSSGGGIFDGKGCLIGLQLGGNPVGFSRAVGINLIKQHWDFLISGGPSMGNSAPFGLSPMVEAFRKAVEPLPPIVVEVLGDGKRRALGTIVSTDGYIMTKASELYGIITCRLADRRVLPVTKVKTSAEHDLALLKIDATGLPQISWRRQQLPVGCFVGAMRYRESPAVSVMALATHSVPKAPGYLVGGKVKEVKGGVEVEELWLNWTRHTLLRKGDVIFHIEGRPTPDLKTFERITKRVGGGRIWEVPQVIAGDLIRVGVRRDGKDLELRFPLLPVMTDHNKVTLRSCAFGAVFDTDAIITRDTCGGPVVDLSGEVVGITIALATRERVYVIPAVIARKVFEHLG